MTKISTFYFMQCFHTSFLVFLTTVIFLSLVGCEKKKAPPAKLAIPVEVAFSETRTVPEVLEVFGTITAINTVTIIPQVTGTLVKTHFEYGKMLNAGDLMFTIDQRPFLAEVARAQADLSAKISAAKVARDKANRNAPLVPKKYISAQEYENLLSQADEAEQAAKAAEANLALADINFGYTTIYAPFRGVTSVKKYTDGDLLEAGTSQVVIINQIDPIQVNFSIPSTQFARVQNAFLQNKGILPITVRSLEDPDGHFIKGHTSFFDNAISTTTGTLLLQGIISNPNAALWVGQYVNVILQLGMIDNAVLVPEAAVAIGPKGPYVFVIKDDNTADFRLVKVGENVDKKIVILDGVKGGEKVVTLGQLKLRQGIEVNITVSNSEGSVPTNLAINENASTDKSSYLNLAKQEANTTLES